jgi:hypothetical protein
MDTSSKPSSRSSVYSYHTLDMSDGHNMATMVTHDWPVEIDHVE